MASEATAGGASPPSCAVTVVRIVEPAGTSALPGMVSDAAKDERARGSAEARAEPVPNEGAMAVVPRNGQDKMSGAEDCNGRRRPLRCLRFWQYWWKIEQQEISSSSLPMRAFCRPAQCGTSGCCSVLFAVLSGLLLSTAGSFEEIIVSYSHTDSSKAFTITEDVEGPVLVWYEIPNLMLNHKYAVANKDDFLWGSMVSTYTCRSAETLKDARWRRPNVTSPGFNSMLAAGGAQEFRPCGLVVLSMYTDTFGLYTHAGAKVILDETDIAIDTDNKIYEKKVVPISGRVKPPFYKIDGLDSWIRSAADLERFKVWMRTPASPIVRHLYGRIPGGLPAGSYSLNFTVNDPIYELRWSVPEKRIILSTSKTLGSVGSCRALGIFCILLAVFEGVFSVLFLTVPPRGSRHNRTAPSSGLLKAETVEPDDS